jgi:hypothetical protein
MCHSIGVVLANEPDMRVVFTCGRGEATGEFAPEHLDRLRRIGPHLVRAASVGLRLLRSEVAASANVEAFDRVAQGVLIVRQAAKSCLPTGRPKRCSPKATGSGLRNSRWARACARMWRNSSG